MTLEGKACAICSKGKLHKLEEEIRPGVYVDAFKCENGHVWYTQEVMRTIEALERETSEQRHVVKVGSSLAVPIPAGIVRHLRLKPKEKVYVRTQDNQIIIRPSPV